LCLAREGEFMHAFILYKNYKIQLIVTKCETYVKINLNFQKLSSFFKLNFIIDLKIFKLHHTLKNTNHFLCPTKNHGHLFTHFHALPFSFFFTLSFFTHQTHHHNSPLQIPSSSRSHPLPPSPPIAETHSAPFAQTLHSQTSSPSLHFPRPLLHSPRLQRRLRRRLRRHLAAEASVRRTRHRSPLPREHSLCCLHNQPCCQVATPFVDPL